MSKKQGVIDHSLPVRKFFLRQLSVLEPIAGRKFTFKINHTLVQKVWVQGIIAVVGKDNQQIIIDDGTAVVSVDCRFYNKLMDGNVSYLVGSQIAIVGFVSNERGLLAHMITNINGSNSETLWMLEVLDVHNLINTTP
eukprot:TRINITY_DN1073_c0_g1_i4.p1 TRINITY_DN1073_c0_g1~~TRINITY_DN1073_c0_g1_i4.p1  ORF type:complete len:138 (+),score=21.66 TRINITY_DN1073_c0_g1_i4:591-1004(+)